MVQNSNEVVFPFRRYQIQNVWRADRPGKGRFQEFTQCDIDVIGSRSMLNEADLVSIYAEVFKALELDSAVLKINHRKLLEAIVEIADLNIPVTRFTSTLDKLDKIGEEGVAKELESDGLNKEQVAKLFGLVISGSLNNALLADLQTKLNGSSAAEVAISELTELLDYVSAAQIDLDIQLDLSLARGLDYYTGCIFEAVVPNSGIGSISGGGRYDDLTGVFGLRDVSGVGISFGIDRIYEIISQMNPDFFEDNRSDMVLLCHFDQASRMYQHRLAHQLRTSGIAAFVFPDTKKLPKQLDYANKKGFRYVLIAGDSEIKSGSVTLKDMESGTNSEMGLDEVVSHLRNQIG